MNQNGLNVDQGNEQQRPEHALIEIIDGIDRPLMALKTLAMLIGQIESIDAVSRDDIFGMQIIIEDFVKEIEDVIANAENAAHGSGLSKKKTFFSKPVLRDKYYITGSMQKLLETGMMSSVEYQKIPLSNDWFV